MNIYTFNKQSTLYIKGIAIILMVCNHLFPIPEWIYPENQFISIPLGSKTLAAYVGGFSKICVAIFAFLTGIAMYYTYSQKSIWGGYKHTLKKLLPFYMTYWIIILFVYIPIMAAVSVFTFNFQEFILNLTGYMTTYCKIAWYVRFYLELVLLFPLVMASISFLYRQSKSREIAIILFLGIDWFLRVILSRSNLPGMMYVTEFMNYLPVVVVGYYIAWVSLFERVAIWLSDRIRSPILLIRSYLVIVGCIFLLRGLLAGNDWFNIDVVLTPIFIGYTWYVLMSFEKISIIRKIENCLAFLGKYSLEIWFLHAIFFIGNANVQRIAYWPRVDVFILAWTILLLIPFAMLVQRIQRKIVNALKI